MVITTKEANERLVEAAREAGGPAAFARQHKLDEANIYAYVGGRMKVGGDVARAIGLQRVMVEAYVPIGSVWAPPDGWTEVPVPERGRGS